MVDEEIGEVVDKADKGRGYELSKGKYVEIDEDELEAIQLESTHTIDVMGRREHVIAIEPMDKGMLGNDFALPLRTARRQAVFLRHPHAAPAARYDQARRAHPRRQGGAFRSGQVQG
jgi:non-homologous end joining protein Ku